MIETTKGNIELQSDRSLSMQHVIQLDFCGRVETDGLPVYALKI